MGLKEIYAKYPVAVWGVGGGVVLALGIVLLRGKAGQKTLAYVFSGGGGGGGVYGGGGYSSGSTGTKSIPHGPIPRPIPTPSPAPGPLPGLPNPGQPDPFEPYKGKPDGPNPTDGGPMVHPRDVGYVTSLAVAKNNMRMRI